jgi:hypothetical protein
VFFVTHLYLFARGLSDARRDDAVFLRAERQADGTRTFRLRPGEPLQTSFGADLYAEIFDTTHAHRRKRDAALPVEHEITTAS